MSEPEQLKDIVTPHAHDVLSGRGNFVNHHSGNENFRALVKRHKKEYVACPKAQKPMYSILIYDEIRSMDPPGRFLKQDPSTKLWSDIGKKKALDKTRQALREGAPEMLKELGGGDENDEEQEEKQTQKVEKSGDAKEKKKTREENLLNASFMSGISIGSFSIDGLNDSMPESIPPVISQGPVPNMMGGGENAQNNQGDTNQGLMSAQRQLIEQQMAQLQQLLNMQNMLQNSGAQIDPAMQLQLLNMQLQLQNQIQQSQQNQMGQQQNQFGQQQNQMGQQQNQMGQQQQSMFLGNNMMNQQQGIQNMQNISNFNNTQVNQNQGFNNTPNFPQMGNGPPSQVNDPNIAALLSAIHNDAANQNNGMQNQNIPTPQSMMQSNNALEQFQNQLAMQQLNQQINNNNANQATNMSNMNNNQWGGGGMGNFNNNNIESILSSANTMHVNNSNNNNSQTIQFSDFSMPLNNESDQNEDQIVGMTLPLQGERKPGGTSYARSQRIGLKNSFSRRPNSHRNMATNLANSLMSLESLNLDDIEEMNDPNNKD